MIVFDGTYRLQRRDDPPSTSFVRWACSWRLRIIDLSMSRPGVKHIRPIIVVATQTGEGLFKTTCAESMGRRICRDFNLDISQILWIEHFPDNPDRMYVASFTPKSYFGPETFYNIDWRPIRSNEIEAINSFIPECDVLQAD